MTRPVRLSPRKLPTQREDDDIKGADEDDNEDEDDDDEEPQLKYAYLTKRLGSVYRNGDATSAFLSAGDKMIIGTHNGNVHVLSLPLLQPLRLYHAHSASVTAISVSPFPSGLPTFKPDSSNKGSEDQGLPPRTSSSSASLRGQKPSQHTPLPATPSSLIYIATSSIDGNVCIASLVDPKDVLLRNFGRPVQAIALSPEYKSDRTFLSGGRAGDLTLTTGGRVGASTNSTTMGSAAATASSWLGTIGLGSDSGKDTVLHSGEGAISTVKWSLSGKYVTWVNEEGIKIMRSNLHLDSSDSELAWKRISHIDRPNLPGWEEMASVWKARAEWIDETSLDTQGDPNSDSNTPPADIPIPPQSTSIKETVEKLVVGWGGTVWVVNVYPNRTSRASRDRNIGSVEVVTILRTDCIISGVSLYTPNLLVVLAYIEAETAPSEERSKRGVLRQGTNHRQKGLEPELRIIDIESKEEISADTLAASRYENLTSSDYHMCLLPSWKTSVPATQRGALGALGNGLWDATMYPARLFNSGASVRSTTSSGDKSSSKAPFLASRRLSGEESLPKEVQEVAGTAGIRIFVHSPYDCIAAVKRDLTDRLAWLDTRGKYEKAWRLLDEHPEAAGSANEVVDAVSDTAAKSQSSLGDFFADDRSSITTTGRRVISAAEQEKRRIGELWIEQLVGKSMWTEAAGICVKVLRTAPRWEHWAWIFIKNNKIDEISPCIPIDLHPSLPSLIYEVILGHYISRNRVRFKELVDAWPLDLFDARSVIAAGEEQLKSETAPAESEDWRILMGCVAKLFLADGHYREALHCYIQLQDADTAMNIIREQRLLDAVSDDIPAFIVIRVSKEQLRSAPVPELEEVTAEPIKLLVSEAYTGIVRPQTVVSQLQAADRLIFLYFYLRALWRGEALPAEAAKPRRGRSALVSDAASKLAADEGKAVVDQFADTAVELFADYDRSLLMEFLHQSTAYTFDTAISICDTRRYTTELIYLLSKMGQTKRALSLILSDLKDVTQAISFAKTQNDPDLWEDLLDYSMDKPRFIHGLLVEAGTSIDPIKLVRRIPSGLEIEGLRDGLTRLIRENDLQASISHGAARVLQSEVAVGMETLRRGQRRGIKFNICQEADEQAFEKPEDEEKPEAGADADAPTLQQPSAPQSGRCGGCHAPFHATEQEILISFACGHVFHLSHVRAENTDEEAAQTPGPSTYAPALDEALSPSASASASTSRTVGPKVTTARLLRERVGGGCRVCAVGREIERIGIGIGTGTGTG
ncbi:vacuolar assembly protein [Aspergillus sp. HF37]|nr:vacuolar assembly protein [Aspergillus sp. HF37]